MQKYIGTKQLKAKSMTRGEYNTLRNWVLPENENGDDEGYLVEYLDGGKPNLKGYENYVSWSPKDVFEKYYYPITGMTFGLALEALKQGLKVRRSTWPKDMYLFMINEASSNWIYMKTVSGDHYEWEADQKHLLVDDWVIGE